MKAAVLLFLLASTRASFAFQSARTFSSTLAQEKRSGPVITNADALQYQRSFTVIHMSPKKDDEDDDYIDDSDLGDWRSFRKTLVDTGLSADSAEEGYIGEETDLGDNEGDSDDIADEDVIDASAGSKFERPKSVSKANEELLKEQSEELAKEYIEGVWAHEAFVPEVGGLVVRLPLEVEIYRSKDKLSIGKELTTRLERDENNSNTTPLFKRSAKNEKKLDLSFSLVAAQTLLWFRKAQSLIEEEMESIAGSANEKGEVNPKMLPQKSENLLQLYLDNQDTWQEVCLVAKRSEVDGSSETYVLNRPMAFTVSENLARLVLFGARSQMIDSRIPVSQQNRYSKFLRAFEKSCAVYVGGPDRVEKQAVLIHGISGLEGAEEIAPGTGIYMGGLDAAIDGVLDGRYKPLDFRFFVGCHMYKDSGLDVAIHSHKYQPIACARSLALKQCIQLPKPLWHEVMEMCGGELREVSRLELMKRDDIIQE